MAKQLIHGCHELFTSRVMERATATRRLVNPAGIPHGYSYCDF
jgi:hypothetical protein